MTATNGSVVHSRKRGRVIGCIMMLALALTGLVFAPAAANAVTPPVSTYMALGDSLSFGYTQEKFAINFPNEAPAYFNEGMTDAFRADLALVAEVGKGIVLDNKGCPGETSNGLIGENEALGGKTSTEGPGKPQGPGDYHPCAYINVNGLPLHDSLSTSPGNAVSQLEAALSVLKGGSPAHPIPAISLQIGSNDELAAIEECKNEIGFEFSTKFYAKQPKPPAPGESTYILNGNPEHDATVEHQAFLACIIGKSLYVTTPRIADNIVKILGAIDVSGKYTGPIVVVNYYNPDTFVLPESDGLQQNLNNVVKGAIESSGLPNIHWADVYKLVNGGTPAQEKIHICKYTEMCNPNVQEPGGLPAGEDGDIHPTPIGYKLMGKIMNEAYLAPAIP
jgi:lysophospholipase L1-like esterase